MLTTSLMLLRSLNYSIIDLNKFYYFEVCKVTSDLLSSSSAVTCPASPSLSSSLSSELLSDASFLLFFFSFPLCLCFLCFFFWGKMSVKSEKNGTVWRSSHFILSLLVLPSSPSCVCAASCSCVSSLCSSSWGSPPPWGSGQRWRLL